ncbi:helix-turn-helix transcriptional regulator [Streptomyces pratensis]|uniref:helix-turn-helix domain-containing protein n=1 Tax=Streptomyces pratensis TaxID=1169025 RepID=UPI003018E5C6
MATPEAVEFAALLKELKDRSGRSYGYLAGRLHVSTSTLHRYCNGDAVPGEFAPAERLARLCGATGDELVEVHRRWIVADAARRRPPTATDAPRAPGRPAAPVDADADADADASAGAGGGAGADASAGADVRAVAAGARPGSRWSRLPSRTRALLASAGVVALLVPTTIVAAGLTDAGGDRGAGGRVVSDGGAGAPGRTGSEGEAPVVAPGGSPTGTPRSSASPAGPSPSAPPPSAASSAASRTDPPRGGGAVGGAPPAVSISSYNWDEPCGQHYLVDRAPNEVDAPPPPQDRRGWAAAYGGIDAGNMLLQLTVQGTSRQAVVLNGLHVRVLSRDAPPPWSAYLMGNGCGSGITPQSFAADLDAGHPSLAPVPGRQGDSVVAAADFPFKVSSEDVEVFNLDLKAVDHDVTWYLELEWSSGGSTGTLRIDDHGKPFRTSGMEGRPEYVYGNPEVGWEPAWQD